jgi:hypothetical protein
MAGYLGRQEDKSNQREKCGRNFTCVASAGTLPHKLAADVAFLQHGRVSHAFGAYENDIIDRISLSVPSQAMENRIDLKTRKAVLPLSSSFGSACAVFSARVIFRS